MTPSSLSHLGGQVEPPDGGVGEAPLHEDPVTPVHPGLVHLRAVGAVVHLVLHQVRTRAQGCGSEINNHTYIFVDGDNITLLFCEILTTKLLKVQCCVI